MIKKKIILIRNHFFLFTVTICPISNGLGYSHKKIWKSHVSYSWTGLKQRRTGILRPWTGWFPGTPIPWHLDLPPPAFPTRPGHHDKTALADHSECPLRAPWTKLWGSDHPPRIPDIPLYLWQSWPSVAKVHWLTDECFNDSLFKHCT